ncbi:MAG: extracellular solute-binding protein, partial [Mycobacterium sp.]|nr:extracellular solute-binding protein [Mycobacterium sp.]
MPASPSSPPGAIGKPVAKTGSSAFPTFRPATSGPKPDFASSGLQYEDGFSNYPRENPKSWTKNPPGSGSNISVLSQARGVGSSTPMTPLEQNPAWKEVNRQLNANVTFTVTPSQDYQAKLAAVMSGSDLPDIILFQGGLGSTNATSSTVGASSTTNLPAFLEHSMADLTPYLGGDAANDYPNLAAIPTFAWKNSGCVYNGKIYMWPVERYRPLNMLFRNTGIWDAELGANYTPTDAADFKRALQQVNRPRDDRYAIVGTNVQYNLQVFPALFGAPNGWALNNGKLTRDIETPEYRESIAYVKDLVDSGLYYPDSLINPATNAGVNTFVQGKGALFVYTFGVNWSTLWSQSQAIKPTINFMPLPLFPAHAGGKPGHFLGPGFIVTNGMKKASPERIQEILRVVDWLA